MKPTSRPSPSCSLKAVEGLRSGAELDGDRHAAASGRRRAPQSPQPGKGAARAGAPPGVGSRPGARAGHTGRAASAALAREALRMPALVLGVAPGLLGEPRGLGALPGAFLAGQPLLLGLGPGAGASPPRRGCLVRAAADARGPRAAHLDPRRRRPRSGAPAALPARAAPGPRGALHPAGRPRRGPDRGGVPPSPAQRFPLARWCPAVPARSCCCCCCCSPAPRRGLPRSVPSRLPPPASRLPPVPLARDAKPRPDHLGLPLGGLRWGLRAVLGDPPVCHLRRTAGPGAWEDPGWFRRAFCATASGRGGLVGWGEGFLGV